MTKIESKIQNTNQPTTNPSNISNGKTKSLKQSLLKIAKFTSNVSLFFSGGILGLALAHKISNYFSGSEKESQGMESSKINPERVARANTFENYESDFTN